MHHPIPHETHCGQVGLPVDSPEVGAGSWVTEARQKGSVVYDVQALRKDDLRWSGNNANNMIMIDYIRLHTYDDV